MNTIKNMRARDRAKRAIDGIARTATSARRVMAEDLRVMSEDLFSFAVQPLPPIRRFSGRVLPWLPHIVISIYAAILLLTGTADYATGTTSARDLAPMVGFALALAQSSPLIVALFRPMAAWWASFAAVVAAALMTFPPTTASVDNWPWTPAGLLAHLGVLILVALRVRVRAVVGIWSLTVALGGVLVAAQQGGDVFGNQTLPVMAFVSAPALIITVAVRERSVALKQLAEQARITSAERSRRALLEERARIARELHDVVAHHMSVIAIQAEAAPYRVQDPPEELTGSLTTIRKNAVDALAELRRILGVLRAEDVDKQRTEEVSPQPMLDHLDELVDNVRAAGLTVEVAVTGARRPLPPGVELSAFRIIQEALSNALKHAPGAPVRVELSYVLAGLGIRVLNARSSLASPDGAQSGHGLLGMRERAAMLGGELSAGPTAEGGYEVAAFLPLTEGEE
jgi:signal transduction histidine kinase